MENSSSWALLALLFISALTLILLFKPSQKRKLPPGPKPWPIIGNLGQLGSIPHQSLHLLSQKYGDIMQLKFGKFPVVVASSPEMAKQFLKVHDAVFASRPALAAGKYTAYNYQDMTWAPYGPHWRQARKIYLNHVFNAKKLESHEHIRVGERHNLFSRLYSLSGKPVVLRDHLGRYAVSTISRMIISNESENGKSIIDMDELKEMLDEWFYLGGVFNIGDWIPWLSFLDLQGYVKKMKALFTKLDGFYNNVIDDHHLAKRDGAEKQDLVDVLLQMVEDPNLEVKLTKDIVKALVQDLLAGGTDTSATAVEWAIYEILKQPRIHEKAKEEVERVIGRNRWVEENDFSQLPYIDAILMETFRLHPLATFLAPHYATEDCKVAGYDISKGTMVYINAWSLGRDPNSWDAPEEFLPDRFLGKDIDIMGSNFAFIPFGSGRRRCPGYNLGLKVVRTTLANLVHGFDLKLTGGMKPEDVCMDEVYGLTTHPKHALSIIMEPTLPPHLY